MINKHFEKILGKFNDMLRLAIPSCIKKSSSTVILRRFVALTTIIFFLFWNIAIAFDGQVTEGDATITPDGNTTTINLSGRAVIEGNMSIGENEIVRVIGTHDLLMKDISGMTTQWLNDLIADGRIVLVNPHGVFIASTANIDVKSLIASTLDLNNALFMQNKLVFEKVEGINAAKILNEANITVKEGQSLVFLAEAIENRGNITAYLGSVAMGVGTKATVSFDSAGMVNLVVSEGIVAPQRDAEGNVIPSLWNTGTITANGGKVQMSAKTMNATFDQLVNNSGVMEAGTAVEKDGMIEFVSNGAVVNEGTLRASEVVEQGSTFQSTDTSTMEVGHMSMDNLDGAADISGSISGVYADTGDLRLTGNVTLTGQTTLQTDSDNDGVGKINMQSFTITGGSNNLILYSGENVTVNAITTTGTVTINASTGTPTYTIANNTSWGALTLNSGILDMNGKTLTLSGAFNQTGGTFNGSTNTITHTGAFALSGGTYNATSGNTNFNNSFTHTAGGTFNAGSGTATFTGSTATIDVATTETFNHLTVAKTGGQTLTIASGDTVVVNGNLTLTDGLLGTGTMNAKGNISIASTWDAGNASYLFNSGVTQTISRATSGTSTLTTGASTISGAETVVAVDPTLTTLTLGAVTLSSGTLNLNNSGLTLSGAYNQSGGTFTGGNGTKTFNSSHTLSSGTFTQGSGNMTLAGTYNQSGGTFDAGSGNLTINNAFTLSGGDFYAPDQNASVGFTYNGDNVNFTLSGAGNYYHENGTVTFGTANQHVLVYTADDNSFWNLILNKHGTYLSLYDELRVLNNLTITATNSITLSSGGGGTTGALAVYGNVYANDADGYPQGGTGVIRLAGSANQTVYGRGNGVITYLPAFEINKSGGTVTMANMNNLYVWSSFALNSNTVINAPATMAIGTTFTQTAGEFYAGNTAFTTYQATTISGGDFYASSTGAMNLYNHLTISNSADFFHNNGTVSFVGGASQTEMRLSSSGSKSFYNIVVNKDAGSPGSGFWDFWSNAITIANNLTIGNSGNTSMGIGYVRNYSGAPLTLYVGGNLTVYDTNIIQTDNWHVGNVSIQFNGIGNQTITWGAGADNIEAGFVVNKASGSVKLGSDLSLNTVGQDLTITSGTFDLDGYNLTVNDAFTVANGANLQLKGTETLSKNPTLSAGSTATYDNTSGTTAIKNWTYTNATLKFDGQGGTFTLPANTTVANLNINAGTLDQGAWNITTGATGGVTVGANGIWTNTSTGDLTVGSGGVTNNGYVRFDGSGAGSGGADAILLRSTTNGTQRNWTGSGIIRMTDVDVKDQAGSSSITAYNSTDSLNNGANWTITANSPTSFTWSGAISDVWNLAGNWAEGIVPTGSDTAVFDVTSLNAATFDGSAIAPGTLLLASGYASALTLGQGISLGNLTIAGGTFNANGHTVDVVSSVAMSGGTYNASTAQNTFTGGITLSGGTFNANSAPLVLYGAFAQSAGTFNGGTSAMSTNSNLTISGGTFTAPTTLSVAGNWDARGGTFTHNNGTVTFNGAAETRTVYTEGDAFYDLDVANTLGGTNQVMDSLSVAHDLDIQTGVLDIQNKNSSVSGTFTNTGTLKLEGAAGQTATGFTVSLVAGTVEYVAQGSTTYSGLLLGDSYNNLTLSGTGTYNLGGNAGAVNLTVGSNITLGSGTHNLNVSGTLSNSGLVTVSSGTITIPNAAAGNFTYTANNSIAGATYGTLTLANGGTASGNLAATTLNMNAGTLAMGTRNLNVSGTLSNSGLITVSSGTITIPNASSGNFTYSSNNTIARATYNTLTMANGGTAQGNISATDLNLNTGTFNVGANNLTVSGTLSNSGLISTSGTGANLSLNGANMGNMTFTNNASSLAAKTYGTLTLANGGTSQGDVVATNLTLNAGTFSVGANNLTVSNTLSNSGTISTSGTGANLSLNGANMGNMTFTNNASSLAAKTYGTLTLANGGTAQGSVTADTLTLSAGTLDVGNSNLTVTTAINNSGTIQTSGTGANLMLTPASVGNVSFSNNASSLAAKTYGTLTLANGGTAQGDVSATDLTLSSGTLNVGGNNLTVSSTLSNSGTISTSGTGANLSLNGANMGNMTFTNNASSLAAKTYGTLTLANGGTAQGDVTATNLTLSAGTLNVGANNLTVSNTLSNSGTISTSGTGANLSLNGANMGNMTFTNNASSLAAKTYGTLTLQNGGTALGDITATDLQVTGGTFNGGAHNITTAGDWDFTNITNVGNVALIGNGTIHSAGKSFGNLTVSGNYNHNDALNVTGIFNQASSIFTSNPLIAFGAHDFRITNGAEFNRYTGAGTVGSPFVISDAYGLQGLNGHLNNAAIHFQLGADIDASNVTNWNSSAGFNPIGNFANAFTGTLDGNGKVINDLTINRSGSDYQGLFGNVGVAGSAYDFALENVSVYGKDHVGGLAGINHGTLTNVFTTGVYTVSGTNYVGGLTGENTGTVSNAYSSARVTGSNHVGGLAGANSGSLDKTYAMGYVTGGMNTGGLVGSGAGAVTSSFWDRETSGQLTSAGGAGKTTVDMMKQATYSGWDMAEGAGTWVMDEGGSYAHFQWRYADGVRGIWGNVFSDDVGLHSAGPGVEIGLSHRTSELAPSVALGTTKTGASGLFYFVIGKNDVQSTNLVTATIVNNALTGSATIDAGNGSITAFDVWGSMVRRLARPRTSVLPIVFNMKKLTQDLNQNFSASPLRLGSLLAQRHLLLDWFDIVVQEMPLDLPGIDIADDDKKEQVVDESHSGVLPPASSTARIKPVIG